MKIDNVEIGRSGAARITVDGGWYTQWPGRTLPTGEPWWAYSHGGQRPIVVTVAETIHELERAVSQAKHPSNPTPATPRPRHLQVVRDLDWTPPHGLARPA